MSTVRVMPDGVKLQGRHGETILDVIRRSGYRCRYGCRRGGCGRCRATLLAGAVDYPAAVADSVLSQSARRAGECLLCRAVPVGEVTVELTDEHLTPVAPWLHNSKLVVSAVLSSTNKGGSTWQ